MGKIFTPHDNDFGNTDAVVIGGGIVGTATAFWLSRAGLDVVLIEMRDGLSTLTTPASAECFRAQFTEPAMAALAIPTDKDTSAGYYMYTPDDQPLIGPVPEVPGFYVNCGYWAGVMLSPQAGKWINDLVPRYDGSQRQFIAFVALPRRSW